MRLLLDTHTFLWFIGGNINLSDSSRKLIECSNCGTEVPKDLSVRVHNCPTCNLSMDRDENAARVLLARALKTVGLTVSACGGLEDTQPVKQETSELEWFQLNLFKF